MVEKTRSKQIGDMVQSRDHLDLFSESVRFDGVALGIIGPTLGI